jgi:hypothetical protein
VVNCCFEIVVGWRLIDLSRDARGCEQLLIVSQIRLRQLKTKKKEGAMRSRVVARRPSGLPRALAPHPSLSASLAQRLDRSLCASAHLDFPWIEELFLTGRPIWHHAVRSPMPGNGSPRVAGPQTSSVVERGAVVLSAIDQTLKTLCLNGSVGTFWLLVLL